ncbi:MAG: HPP family protein [Solirubrobacterales bacterium]|nr:HPP family protein [Solirubrobacterales bacterium]
MTARPKRAWRLFRPILAGATARDRATAALAVGAATLLVGVAGVALYGDHGERAWIVAPIAASAVLLFVVPSSPLAQPWPVVGGNAISALVGVAVAHVLGGGPAACALAVTLAVAAMSLTRSLHPPGGAMALTATLGGPAVESADWLLPLTPVATGALALVAAGWAFNRLLGHAYPHRAPAPAARPPSSDPAPSRRVGLRPDDVDAVLAEMGEAFDIDRDDLAALLGELEARVVSRERSGLRCGDIMSRDVISVARDAEPAVARALLLDSGVRLLPVLDGERRPVGGVGLRELARPADAVAAVMSPPLTVEPEDPVTALVGPLTDGRRHAAMVVDGDGRLAGLVAQADLLAALARPAAAAAGTA